MMGVKDPAPRMPLPRGLANPQCDVEISLARRTWITEGGADPFDTLVVLWPQVNILDETFPAAERQRDDHEMQIINESGPQVLTDCRHATAHHDILPLCGLSRWSNPPDVVYTPVMDAPETTLTYRVASGSKLLWAALPLVCGVWALACWFWGVMTILNFRLPVLAVFPLLLGVEWAYLSGLWLFRGWRVAYLVEITADRLVWRAPYLTLEFPLCRLQELHRRRFPSRTVSLDIEGGQRLLILRKTGFVSFAVALGRAAPSMQVWA
jgi:hypothetical protein